MSSAFASPSFNDGSKDPMISRTSDNESKKKEGVVDEE
jgi:hypothetical protein